jgi:hypothetical protein
MRRTTLPIALVVVMSCSHESGSSTPSSPTPPSPPAPTPQPVNTWAIAGTLVDTAGRQPIAGASITPTWDLAAIESGADGSYQLGAIANPPTTPYRLTIAGSDLVSREVWVSWQSGARVGVTFDAIRNRSPFSLEFYRQFVRGTYDNNGPWANFRWMQSPSFYVKTVDQKGRPVEPEVLAVVRDALVRAVHEYSAGVLSVVALESGTETRAAAVEWINVDIKRDPNERTTCGFADIGANPGSITLNDDVCACGSNKIPGALVMHEVGHALGFFHVPDKSSVMYPFIPGNCPSGQLSPAEKFHAAIAYSRPRGNRDPDIDPNSGPFSTPMPTIRVDR